MLLFSKKKADVPRRRQQAHIQTDRVHEVVSLDEQYAFRRNRTLTGSSSSKVVSTNESKAQLKSPRVQAHELARQRRHIGAVLVFVVVCAAILYFLISQFTAGAIVHTEDVSMKLDPIYEQDIQSYLATQPLERLRFLINASRLQEYIQGKSPEIASIRIDGSAGFGKTAFIVTMRHPIAGWSINGHQEYVDASGVAFTQNYFAPPSVEIVDNSGIQAQAGQAVASDSFLGFVGRAVGFSKAQGYIVTQVIIPANTTREVELRLQGINYSIKLSVDRGAGEQIEDMARAVKWFASHGQSPQYVDVRVSGKAFYR